MKYASSVAPAQVSSFCLGGMMFGAWGNPGHDGCVALM